MGVDPVKWIRSLCVCARVPFAYEPSMHFPLSGSLGLTRERHIYIYMYRQGPSGETME